MSKPALEVILYRFRLRSPDCRTLALCLLLISAVGPFAFLHADKLFDKAAKKKLAAMVGEICDGLLTQPSGEASATKTGASDEGAMITEGTTARALAVRSVLSKEALQCLQASQQWADSFAGLQHNVPTGRGNPGGCWLDPGGAEVDLASNGIAAAALARVLQQEDGARRNTQLKVLENYARFLLEGSREDPGGKNRGASSGWIISQGENKGAFGGGYLKDRLSVRPSTMATAANAAFLAQMYALTRNSKYRDISADAVRWLVKVQSAMGDIPNLIDGKATDEAPIQTMAWCGDAILSAYYLLQDTTLNQQMVKEIEPVTRWLVRTQNEKGLWGEGPDQRGSTGVVTLLAWFCLSGTKDEAFSQAVDKAWQVFSNPVHAQSFGVNVSRLTTAMLGLTTAEMIKPGICFKSTI
jgi:hypothetical protein